MSSALCFPHSLSYFNEFAGGPSGGHEHLLGSAVSWGQDLLMVKHWHDCHPDARPFYYWPDGAINPRTVGLEVGTVMYGIPRTSTSRAPVPLEAGWHAVDVHYLHPRSNDVAQRSESTTTGRRPDSDALFGLKPLYRIGYSTLVYYVPFNPTADAVDPR